MNVRIGASSAFLAAVFLSANAAQAANAPQPATVLFGGGATLPAEAYSGSSFLTANPPLRLTNTLPPLGSNKTNANAVSKASLFWAYAATVTNATAGLSNSAVGVSYCQTGSGAGRRMLTGNTASNELANKACGDYSGTPLGFGSPNALPDFIGTDAPLNGTEVNTFNTNLATSLAGKVQAVQLPEVAASVAIVYSNSALGKTQLVLTQSDICGIFSGQITDWSGLKNTPKVTIASKPIKVLYRTDGSGTTFSFTNYLSYVCPALSSTPYFSTATGFFTDAAGTTPFTGVATGNVAVTGFRTTDTFAGQTTNLTGNGARAYSGFDAGMPASFIGRSGNGGVVSALADTTNFDGAIGYADIADAVARAKLAAGSSVKYALVSYAADVAKGTVYCNASTTANATLDPKGKCATTKAGKFTKLATPAYVYNKLDPAKNFPAKGTTAVAVTINGDKTFNGIDANGRPALVTITPTASQVAGCVGTVLPNDYAAPVAAATAKAPADYATYPIVAISYLATYGGGYGNNLSSIRNLLSSSYDSTIMGKVKTIGAKTGYAALNPTFVGGPAGVTTAAGFAAACIQN